MAKKDIGIKKSTMRSEIKTYKGKNGNYLIIRFRDDKNSNAEYHVYCEVKAKPAARDVAKCEGIKLPPNEKKGEMNVRTLWDLIWTKL